MSLITIHAGMPKAASSTVQTWLGLNRQRLREDHDTVILRATGLRSSGAEVVVEPAEGRSVVSARAVVIAFLARGSNGPQLAASLATAIDQHACKHRAVVLTSEGLTQLLLRGNKNFLSALEELARDHDVRIAYYVRPQNEALEACWRQWGFRTGTKPSIYLEANLVRMDYLGTRRCVLKKAPGVAFSPRPLRRDLLDGGNVLVDFAARYLDLTAASVGTSEIWANPGLPLELVNELQGLQETKLWGSIHDNVRLEHLKGFLQTRKFEESARVRDSREVLRAIAHHRFEADNRELASLCAWGTDHWIPAPNPELGVPPLSVMDELWAPAASPAIRGLLHEALAFVAAHEGHEPTVDPGRDATRGRGDVEQSGGAKAGGRAKAGRGGVTHPNVAQRLFSKLKGHAARSLCRGGPWSVQRLAARLPPHASKLVGRLRGFSVRRFATANRGR